MAADSPLTGVLASVGGVFCVIGLKKGVFLRRLALLNPGDGGLRFLN